MENVRGFSKTTEILLPAKNETARQNYAFRHFCQDYFERTVLKDNTTKLVMQRKSLRFTGVKDLTCQFWSEQHTFLLLVRHLHVVGSEDELDVALVVRIHRSPPPHHDSAASINFPIPCRCPQ